MRIQMQMQATNCPAKPVSLYSCTMITRKFCYTTLSPTYLDNIKTLLDYELTYIALSLTQNTSHCLLQMITSRWLWIAVRGIAYLHYT